MFQIYYNGEIISMGYDDESEELNNDIEAVLVENGVIKYVGNKATAMKMADENVDMIDLDGKCLMPGFIDAHSHFVMNGQMSSWADLSECESLDDVVITLKQYIADNNIDKDGVVLGFGYDHNFIKGYKHPDKITLDRVSTEIPIFVLHVSAHLACVNSVSLNLAGITSDTIEPEGGRIGRLNDGTEPSGYFEEAGLGLVQGIIMSRAKINPQLMMEKVQKVYIENGVTTVQDGASNISDIRFLIEMNRLKKLDIDVVAFPLMTSNGIDMMQQYGEEYKDYNNRLKIGGYKIVLDGSPQGRSAWMSKPYENSDNYCGYAWLKNEVVDEYVYNAVEQGKQILAHCNGDAASDQFLTAYEKAAKLNGNAYNLRPVMIHCQTVRNDQLDKMASLNMIASIFVGHVWFWGDVHLKNFGEFRGKHISPVRDAVDRGVKVTFHQDTPVTKPNMLHSIWCAVNRKSREGKIIGDNQSISVYEALKMVTINAAYQYFEDNNKGTIEAGKRADFVILDNSPLKVDKTEIKNINVLKTIKDGKLIFQRN